MGHRHQTTDATRIQRLVDEGVPATTLAEAFGVSKEAINSWLKSNVAPYWTKLACEALERRRGKSGKTLLVCTLPSKNFPVAEGVIKSLAGEILAIVV